MFLRDGETKVIVKDKMIFSLAVYHFQKTVCSFLSFKCLRRMRSQSVAVPVSLKVTE